MPHQHWLWLTIRLGYRLITMNSVCMCIWLANHFICLFHENYDSDSASQKTHSHSNP
jgi:hypothetical protein